MENRSTMDHQMGDNDMAGHDHHQMPAGHTSSNRLMFATVTIGVCHCGAGCLLGDIVGEWLVYAEFLIGTPSQPLVLRSFLGSIDLLTKQQITPSHCSSASSSSTSPSRPCRVTTAQRPSTARSRLILSLTSFEIGLFGWMAIFQIGIFDW
jgi:hypothetical protein